jgi:hypothetical protein
MAALKFTPETRAAVLEAFAFGLTPLGGSRISIFTWNRDGWDREVCQVKDFRRRAVRMARGGHGKSGPAPDPQALRRERDGVDWITLPADGRKGRAPKWPLSKQTAREKSLWAPEWKRPQAVMWERNGQEIEVALYVRSLAEAERDEATVAARTLVRQFHESLGISLPGLARNRWIIQGSDAPIGSKRPATVSDMCIGK